MSELSACDYDHYDVLRCRRNMNFEEIGTELSTRKLQVFITTRNIFKEYIKQNVMAVLRKANAHSVVLCRLIQGEKLVQALVFLKLPSAYEISIRRNVMQCIYLLHQKRLRQVVNSDRQVEGSTPWVVFYAPPHKNSLSLWLYPFCG